MTPIMATEETVPCPVCDGTARWPRCPYLCHGFGRCSTCDDTGYEVCAWCQGTARMPRDVAREVMRRYVRPESTRTIQDAEEALRWDAAMEVAK